MVFHGAGPSKPVPRSNKRHRNSSKEPYPPFPTKGAAKALLHAYGQKFQANDEEPTLLASVASHNKDNSGAMKAFERLCGISSRSYNYPGESLIEVGFSANGDFEPQNVMSATHFRMSAKGKAVIEMQIKEGYCLPRS